MGFFQLLVSFKDFKNWLGDNCERPNEISKGIKLLTIYAPICEMNDKKYFFPISFNSICFYGGSKSELINFMNTLSDGLDDDIRSIRDQSLDDLETISDDLLEDMRLLEKKITARNRINDLKELFVNTTINWKVIDDLHEGPIDMVFGKMLTDDKNWRFSYQSFFESVKPKSPKTEYHGKIEGNEHKKFLINNSGSEIILSDQYILSNRKGRKSKDKDRATDLFFKEIKKVVEEVLKIFDEKKKLRHILILFNDYSYNVVENYLLLKQQEYSNSKGLTREVKVSLININENGRSDAAKVEGIFHKRELLAHKYRVSFDTGIRFDNWTNHIEFHPYYFGNDLSFKTRTNEWRGWHLYRFLFYLNKLILLKEDMSKENIDESEKYCIENIKEMAFIKKFEEAIKFETRGVDHLFAELPKFKNLKFHSLDLRIRVKDN